MKIENKDMRFSLYFNLSLTLLLAILIIAMCTIGILDVNIVFYYMVMLTVLDLAGILYTRRLLKTDMNLKKIRLMLFSSIIIAVCLLGLLFLLYVGQVTIALLIINVSLSTLLAVCNIFYIRILNKKVE